MFILDGEVQISKNPVNLLIIQINKAIKYSSLEHLYPMDKTDANVLYMHLNRIHGLMAVGVEACSFVG